MRLAVRIPRVANAFSALLVIFLVLFPKGGIKAAGIPVTWGYLLLGAAFVLLLPPRILAMPMPPTRLALLAMGSLLPFYIVLFFTFLAFGIDSAAFTVSMLTSFVVFPILFLLILPPFLLRVDAAGFKRCFRFCVLAAAVWGILLFFYHPIAGKYIEIPYLTVNAADYGQLETTKHIDRGNHLKLISTYNNGNVYGVATLILLPLFFALEPKLWKRNTLRFALLLTLSRTVWFGLILEQAISFFAHLPAVVSRFPRIRPGPALNQAIALAATIFLVFAGVFVYSSGLGFIFSRSLGGREGELAPLLHPNLLPSIGLGGFTELLYASALSEYGIVGMLAVLLLFAFPLALLAVRPSLLRDPIRRAAAKGVMIYAVVAGIDGATNLIPVMCFYWFAYSTMLFGLPGDPPLRSMSGTSIQPLPTGIPPVPTPPQCALGLLHS